MAFKGHGCLVSGHNGRFLATEILLLRMFVTRYFFFPDVSGWHYVTKHFGTTVDVLSVNPTTTTIQIVY